MDRADEGRRRRRRHSAQFKAKVVQACTPGASVAAVALAHGLNANLVRRWVQRRDAGVSGAVALAAARLPAAAFVPVQIPSPSPSPSPTLDIRLELRRGAATVVVSWPAQEAAACSRWLKEWLG
jgi:transposase